jgi:hypothetical protein
MQYARKVALVPIHMLKDTYNMNSLNTPNKPNNAKSMHIPIPKITENVKTKVLTELSRDMDDIMNNENLTSEEKLNVHYQMLQRLRHHMNIDNQPYISKIPNQTQNLINDDDGDGPKHDAEQLNDGQVITHNNFLSSKFQVPNAEMPRDRVTERKLFPPTEPILNSIHARNRLKAESILNAMMNSHGSMGWTTDNKLIFNGQVVPGSDIIKLLKAYVGQSKTAAKPTTTKGYEQFQNGLENLPGLNYLRSTIGSKTSTTSKTHSMLTRKYLRRQSSKTQAHAAQPFLTDKRILPKADAQKKKMNQLGMGIFSEWKSFSQKH